MQETNKIVRIYLDDVRTPIPTNFEKMESDDFKLDSWVVVRNYQEFTETVERIGLENIHIISLDHDLGDSAMSEYFNNVHPNYTLDYGNITEKTGYDCAKWLVNHFYERFPEELEAGRVKGKRIKFPKVYTHSANPIGAANIMGYINNFLMNEGQAQSSVRVVIPHTV